MERFVRCRHCNLPHVASVLRCPFTGKAVDPQTRLPDEGAWVPSRDALTGTLLDERYLVGANIGDGAMGTVYRAEHVNLGTEVAVKVLHSRFEAGSAAEKRFLREGHSAGRIDHPNVVRIFDVGRLPDGAPYLVMELLEGEELSASIPEGGLPPARVADLADQLLRGLEQAHAQRVVHRDIKPDNVFLALEGGVEVLKILDFSIAKDQAADADARDQDAAVFRRPNAAAERLHCRRRADPARCHQPGHDGRTGARALPRLGARLAGRDPPPASAGRRRARRGLDGRRRLTFRARARRRPIRDPRGPESTLTCRKIGEYL